MTQTQAWGEHTGPSRRVPCQASLLPSSAQLSSIDKNKISKLYQAMYYRLLKNPCTAKEALFVLAT